MIALLTSKTGKHDLFNNRHRHLCYFTRSTKAAASHGDEYNNSSLDPRKRMKNNAAVRCYSRPKKHDHSERHAPRVSHTEGIPLEYRELPEYAQSKRRETRDTPFMLRPFLVLDPVQYVPSSNWITDRPPMYEFKCMLYIAIGGR